MDKQNGSTTNKGTQRTSKASGKKKTVSVGADARSGATKRQKIKQKKVEKVRVSRMAGKELIALTKELQKVQLEKAKIAFKNYSEEQGGAECFLYEFMRDDDIKACKELGKREAELEARIERLKNGA